jgi:DNA-binding response OmpR family regulator
MQQLLMIEDDARLAQMVGEYLERSGFTVTHAIDAKAGMALLQAPPVGRSPDLVILDLMLPDMDGLEVCRRVRALPGETGQVPVLMLTAKGDPMDRIVGLELGADDYIAKPYSPRELLARIKAIHRRSSPESPSPRYYRFLGFTLDAVERRLLDEAGETINLTGLDYQLLKYFVDHPGEILDRGVLCEETRGRNAGPLDRSLDVQISRLRMRLNDDAKSPWLIKTVRGAGYVFSAEVSVSHH